MKKAVVQSLWIDNVLGDHQKICIQSFLRNDVEYHLYTYGNISNIPNGVMIRNAHEIIPKDQIFKDLFDSYATFSDWFRIKLLYDRGGWWVDADMLCVQPFHIASPFVFATERFCKDERTSINICNCVIKMPKGSDMGKSMLHSIENIISAKDPKSIKWTSIGAKIIVDEVVLREMFDYVVSPDVFCPIDYLDYKKIFNDQRFKMPDVTYGIHLWNKMWEWSEKNPLKDMDKDSFFARYINP